MVKQITALIRTGEDQVSQTLLASPVEKAAVDAERTSTGHLGWLSMLRRSASGTVHLSQVPEPTGSRFRAHGTKSPWIGTDSHRVNPAPPAGGFDVQRGECHP
jgi:hypothetical protein